jgi:hypothetical protein
MLSERTQEMAPSLSCPCFKHYFRRFYREAGCPTSSICGGFSGYRDGIYWITENPTMPTRSDIN